MAKINASTQGHLDIANIKNNIVILKNGGAAAILQTNAINFDLLSVQEQDAAIGAFSSILNSLTFPIQITIRSKKLDITEYLEKVKDRENKQTNPKIKQQIAEYRSFIKDDLVVKDNVLEKSFYVTIPYKTFEISAANPFGWITDLFMPATSQKGKINVDKILNEATSDLQPKIDFLIKEFGRLQIRATQMKTADLIKLFYSIYNSETVQSQKIRGTVEDYTATLVEPKLA